MSEKLITGSVAILTAIVGVAIIATLVSNQAQTGSLITSGGGAFSRALCTALSPLGVCNTPSVSSTISFG